MAYLLFQGMLALTGWRELLPLSAGIAAAAALGAAFEWALGRTPGSADPRPRPRKLAWTAAALLLLCGVDLGRGAAAFAAPERSIARAGEEVAAILHPAAHLTGPFAHTLTWESPHRRSFHPVWRFGSGRLGRELRQAGFSHFAVDVTPGMAGLRRTFQADGAALRLVHEFVIRGQKVHLYRFPWADEIAPPTDFELGVMAIQEADWTAAEGHLRRGQASRPDSSTIASALGLVLIETGRPREAREHLERAIEANPYEISACRSLLRLLLEARDLAAARGVLERLVDLDPGDQEAARLQGKF